MHYYITTLVIYLFRCQLSKWPEKYFTEVFQYSCVNFTVEYCTHVLYSIWYVHSSTKQPMKDSEVSLETFSMYFNHWARLRPVFPSVMIALNNRKAKNRILIVFLRKAQKIPKKEWTNFEDIPVSTVDRLNNHIVWYFKFIFMLSFWQKVTDKRKFYKCLIS